MTAPASTARLEFKLYVDAKFVRDALIDDPDGLRRVLGEIAYQGVITKLAKEEDQRHCDVMPDGKDRIEPGDFRRALAGG